MQCCAAPQAQCSTVEFSTTEAMNSTYFNLNSDLTIDNIDIHIDIHDTVTSREVHDMLCDDMRSLLLPSVWSTLSIFLPAHTPTYLPTYLRVC